MTMSTLARSLVNSLMSPRQLAAAAIAGCLMLTAPVALALDEDECRAHRESFLASLARNRTQSLRDLERGAAGDTSDEARERLEYQRAQVFDHEERLRAMGDQIWRDCMAHVRAVGSAPGTSPGQ